MQSTLKRCATSAPDTSRHNIHSIEKAIIASGVTFNGADEPTNTRWWAILTVIPALGTRSIYERFDTELSAAYAKGNLDEMIAYCELMDLRRSLYETLILNGIGMPHISYYEMEYAEVWASKLDDKIVACTAEKDVAHDWLN